MGGHGLKRQRRAELRGGYSASMRIVAVLSVAFVVLVGVVAVTYPNESDEVRQRNAAFMKLGDGDTPGGLKADPEQGDAGFTLIDGQSLKAGDLLGISAEDLDAVCQDLNQISRILKKLGANDPNLRDLRTAVERTQNNLKNVQIVSATDFHTGGGILGSCALGYATTDQIPDVSG